MCASAAADDGAELSSFRWRNRLIVVFAPTAAAADDAKSRLDSAPGIDERDIAWFVLEPAGVHSNIDTPVARTSLARLHRADGFEAVLVGKDAAVKQRQTAALNLPALFDAIDAMPMRRREIRER